MFSDNKEIRMALLQYRNTSIIDGCSPAQLLMNRKLANYRRYNRHMTAQQNYTAKYYNNQELHELNPGTKVLV